MLNIAHLNFVGRVRDCEFCDLSSTAIINAFRTNGWREHSDDRRKYNEKGEQDGELTHKSGGRVHFVQQLRKDGPTVGIPTLGHFARAMRDGYSQQSNGGKVLRFVPSGRAYCVLEPNQGWLITFRHA